jgi:outer membrane lipopolysaccharide assembly protein LptE/RlpB
MKKLLFVLILLLLSGCGYRLATESLRLPDNASTLSVEMFVNLTMEPYLENILTTQVIRRFLLFPEITLVEDQEKAEAIIHGTILSYDVEASAYDGLNVVTQYRATMKVEAEFRRRSNGRILWRGTLIRFQPFAANPDLKRQDDLERIAQNMLSTRIAEDLSSRLTETF